MTISKTKSDLVNEAISEFLPSHHMRDEWLLFEERKKSPLEWMVAAFAVVFGIWHILTNLFLNEPGMWQNAIHFAGFAFLAPSGRCRR